MRMTQYPRLNEGLFAQRLENGLQVFVSQRPGYQKAFAFFAVNYGGMDTLFRLDGALHRTPEGVAHFLEHKLFDMPDGNALQTLSAMGASPNAFTSSSMTAYHFECTKHFYSNLRTLLSFVSTPYFTAESVAKEQGIIAQEIQMIADRPGWQVYSQLLKGLYWHNPVRTPVAGSLESITQITPEVLYHCHKAFYRPDNMVLCVVGDVDAERVAATARMTIAPAKGTAAERVMEEPEPADIQQALSERTMPISSPTFLAGFKAQPVDDLRSRLIGDLAGDLLCGTSSALYHRLYQNGLVDQSFGVSYEEQRGTSFLVLGGDSAEPKQVAEAVLAEAERLRREGIPEEDFRRTLRSCYGSRVQALDSFQHSCYHLTTGYFGGFDYYQFPTLYDAIAPEDVLEFLDQLIRSERMALSIVRPNKEG